MRTPFFLLLFIFIPLVSIFSQDNTVKFNTISEQIEKLLRYKEKSSTQLRILLKDLESYSQNNKNEFIQIQQRVNSYLLPIEIKLIRSDIYRKKYRNAVDQTKQIKLNYSYSTEIEKLDKYLDRKLYSNYKNLMIQQKPSLFSLEPSLSLYTQERLIDDVTKISNLNPVYGLGLYYKFKNEKKENSSKIPRFSFSQIGLKFDYRDNSYSISKDSEYLDVYSYLNSQISFLYRKTLGLDVGVIQYMDLMEKGKTDYSMTASLYIPIRFFSLGAHARVISDLNLTQPTIQIGTSLKFNIGIYKPYSSSDKDEVKSQIIKFKENK